MNVILYGAPARPKAAFLFVPKTAPTLSPPSLDRHRGLGHSNPYFETFHHVSPRRLGKWNI